MKRYIVYSLLMLLFCSCNPRLMAPTVDIPESYLYQDLSQTDTLKFKNQWWEEFADTTLNRLITTALASNNDLKAAASKVLQAQQSLRTLRSQYLPSFGLGREVAVSASGSTVTQYYAFEPTVSWEIPLFGSLRSATVEAGAEIEYAQWQHRGMRLSVAAQVATLYYTLLQYRRDLQVAIESSRLRAETALLTDSLFSRGLATGMHRQQALSLLYTAQSDIPRYERQVRQTMVDLATLIGTNDIDTAAYRTLDINAVNNYPTINIPVGLPSYLLSRRSDIASAYALLVKAAAQAKQARIARLPTLSLTAEAGLVSDEVKDFLKTKSISWSALLDFAQPLYRFGALKANEKSAIEQYNQALYNYRQSFVTALMEVESSLVEIATVRTQTERYKELIVSNRKIAELSIALYRNGLSSYLDVIDASRTLYDSQMQYSNLVASMYIAYIKLFKALGGEV